MPLSPRRQRFVEEYLKDQNATQAAIRAGYAPRAAQEQSSRLLSNAIVRDAVDKLLAEQAVRVQVTADDIVREAYKVVQDEKAPAIARVKAMELLSKRHREFSERFQVSGDPEGTPLVIERRTRSTQ